MFLVDIVCIVSLILLSVSCQPHRMGWVPPADPEDSVGLALFLRSLIEFINKPTYG